VRSTAAPYTESRLTHLVRNKCVGFPVVEQYGSYKAMQKSLSKKNLLVKGLCGRCERVEPERRLEGQQFTKLGQKYQHD
jgi:hypothetical protein